MTWSSVYGTGGLDSTSNMPDKVDGVDDAESDTIEALRDSSIEVQSQLGDPTSPAAGSVLATKPTTDEKAALAGTDGSPAAGNPYVTDSDPRMTDSRTPSSHASSHVDGGSDELDGDTLDIDFTPSNYTPDATPAEANDVDDLAAHLQGIDTAIGLAGGGSHASTHVDGGADEINGDLIDITFTPTNYSPDATPAEANDVDDLAAHLKGIDDALTPVAGSASVLVTEEILTTDTALNDTSFNEIFSQTITAQTDERVLISAVIEISENDNSDVHMQIKVDGTVVQEIWHSLTFSRALTATIWSPELTAGSRTISVEAKTTAGSATVYADSASDGDVLSKLQIAQFRAISEADGITTQTDEDSPTSPQLIDTDLPSWEDITGLSHSVTTTKANEKVLVTFSGVARTTSAAGNPHLALLLDSSIEHIVAENIGVSTGTANLSFSYVMEIPTPGTYTIKLQGSKISGDSNWELDGLPLSGTQTEGPKFQVTQFAGGFAAPTVLEILNAFPSGSVGPYNTGSYGDIDSNLETTFSVPNAGTYLVTFRHQIFTNNTGCDCRLRFVFDESDYNGFTEQTVEDDSGSKFFFNTGGSGHRNEYTFVFQVTLAAGEHKMKPQWKFEGGANGLNVDTVTAFYAVAVGG